MIPNKPSHCVWVINYKIVYVVVINNICYACWCMIPLRILILIICLFWSICLSFLWLTFLNKIIVFLCLIKTRFLLKCLSCWFFRLLLSLRWCLYAVSKSCFRFSLRSVKGSCLVPCGISCFQIDCAIDVVTYVAIFIHLDTL